MSTLRLNTFVLRDDNRAWTTWPECKNPSPRRLARRPGRWIGSLRLLATRDGVLPDLDARNPSLGALGVKEVELPARPPERVFEVGNHQLLANGRWLHGSGNR